MADGRDDDRDGEPTDDSTSHEDLSAVTYLPGKQNAPPSRGLVSIVVPALNEAPNIPALLKRFCFYYRDDLCNGITQTVVLKNECSI